MNAHAPAPVPARLDTRQERARLDRAMQDAARLAERRDAAIAQDEALTRMVGLAKGRLVARKPVEALLDELQLRQNRRNLGTFESLLTALVQEVLPGEAPIRLELSTERNLPALHVLSEPSEGVKEDVYDDQGGAITNVLSAGLRLITVVKSRSALFVALDEADCWIKPTRAPAFYRVLQDAARQLGVQCLAISHHDIETFGGDIHVSALSGNPKLPEGVRIGAPVPEPSWPDPAARGLRHLRLVDVQGYVDETLHLGPGVNALIGENNNGKSTVARALRALFLGEVGDTLIRHGAKRCVVEAGVGGGRVLRFMRQAKGAPANTWSLHEADGSVVTEGNERYETGSRTVPDWVARLFGIGPVQDLQPHISFQKEPVFLLDDGPSKRASVLSVGQEADYARMMIRVHKERCTADAAEVRDGERTIADMRRLAARLEGVPALAGSLEALVGELDALADEQVGLGADDAVLEALVRSGDALRKAHGRTFLLQDLPEPALYDALVGELRAGVDADGVADRLTRVLDDWHAADARARVLDALPESMPQVESTQALADAGNAVRVTRRALAKARARGDLLRDLPASAPEPDRTDADAAALAALLRGKESLRKARETEARLAREEAAARAQLDAILEATGGRCPACGQSASADTLLQGHAHP
jgi:hypothetical protein